MADDANRHLRTAVRRLESAQRNLKSGDSETSVNRAYYAAFEAARAALVAVGESSSKTHSGVNNQFGEHCVRKGVVGKKIGRYLGRLFAARLTADYHGVLPTSSEAQAALHMAEMVVVAVRDAISPQFDIEIEVSGAPKVSAPKGLSR